jgi:hypothetical protein
MHDGRAHHCTARCTSSPLTAGRCAMHDGRAHHCTARAHRWTMHELTTARWTSSPLHDGRAHHCTARCTMHELTSHHSPLTARRCAMHNGRAHHSPLDDGRWTMDDGRWTMDDGRWTMHAGARWAPPSGGLGSLRLRAPWGA